MNCSNLFQVRQIVIRVVGPIVSTNYYIYVRTVRTALSHLTYGRRVSAAQFKPCLRISSTHVPFSRLLPPFFYIIPVFDSSFVLSLLFLCARYSLWDALLVHGISVLYGQYQMVHCFSRRISLKQQKRGYRSTDSIQ